MLAVTTLRALKDNFIYVLSHQDERCAVVDPGDALPVENYIRNSNLKLDYLLLTHHHTDHVGGAKSLIEHHGCEAWASKYDKDRLNFPVHSLLEKTEYALFGERLEVLEIPGHTLGQIGFYFPDLQSLFVGDTLFSAGCGRLFEGTPEMMFHSLQKIKSLPPETKIYIGHEYTLNNIDFAEFHKAVPLESLKAYKEKCQKQISLGHDTTPTTLHQELLINPFLRATSVEEFAHWRDLRNQW